MIWAQELKREHVQGAVLHANRSDMIQAMDLGRGPVIAEIGVALGDFSDVMIEHFKPSIFHAYDIYTMHEWPHVWGRPTQEAFEGKTHWQFYHDRFAGLPGFAMFSGDSSTNLNTAWDESYDLIYIDGAHDYQGASWDAQVAVKKVKRDGVLIFNDYLMYDHVAKVDYGVVQVVNDLCVNHGWRITDFALHSSMFCDIALKRRD